MGVESGYREVEHTADWELHVWGADMPALLEQAARGMYALMGARPASPERSRRERCAREFDLPFTDREALLVDFLSELLFLTEAEGLVFNQYRLALDGDQLHARVIGAPLEALSKEIKAVTFHGMTVRETGRGLEVNIVFDV